MTLDKLLNDQRNRRRDLLRVEKFVLGDQWDGGDGGCWYFDIKKY